ncbi:hypothetical protein SAMN04487974_12624 [Pelagibacterium luteolum]|uniref:Uncharacterized protein n=1 Tax=Pelagibacterium luteolum TaxID=440168 RepID=A0A1G8A627_9HYPH|nr:hypothetical protein SAMN04487974_12624 [Pelagibacterium luteolum]
MQSSGAQLETPDRMGAQSPAFLGQPLRRRVEYGPIKLIAWLDLADFGALHPKVLVGLDYRSRLIIQPHKLSQEKLGGAASFLFAERQQVSAVALRCNVLVDPSN